MKGTGLILIKKNLFDYFSTVWGKYLKTDEQNCDYSTETFLNQIHTYGFFKKIRKYKLKLKDMLWITPGFQKSISVKNKFSTSSLVDHLAMKNEFHRKYKSYMNF